MRFTGRLRGNLINVPEDWVGTVDVDSIVVHLTPVSVWQELFVKSIDYGRKINIQSASGNNVDCYYIVEANALDVPQEKLPQRY
jgi:hypothetical protein